MSLACATSRLVLALILSLFGQGSCMASTGVEADASALAAALRAGRIERIEIVHVAYGTLTRVNVDAAQLLKIAESRCEVNPSSESAAALATAVDQARIREEKGDPDLRWGLLLQSRSGQAEYSLFLDGEYITGTGRRGVLNGNAIALNGSVVRWIERAFSTTCPSVSM
jgi:hypothetical protein